MNQSNPQEMLEKIRFLRIPVNEAFDAIHRGEYESITDENLAEILASLRCE